MALDEVNIIDIDLKKQILTTKFKYTIIWIDDRIILHDLNSIKFSFHFCLYVQRKFCKLSIEQEVWINEIFTLLADVIINLQSWHSVRWSQKRWHFRKLEKIQMAFRSLNKVSFDRFFSGPSEIINFFTPFWGIWPQFWILEWIFC